MRGQRFLVIGGGVVGSAAAHRLATVGHSVQLVDAGHPDAASGAAAGVISPGSLFSYGGTPPEGFTELAVAASRYYPRLAENLGADRSDDCGYTEPGALIVATDDDELNRLDAVLEFVLERRAMGAANIGDAVRLSAAEARRMHPLLGPETLAAVHIPGVGRVDGSRLVAALRASAVERGAEVIHDRVTLTEAADRVLAVGESGRSYEADHCIVAAGCWTTSVLDAIGVSVPVSGEAGEMVYVHVPDAPPAVPIVMGFVHTRYTLPVGPQQFGLGATQRAPAEQIAVRTGGVAAILAETTRVLPPFADAFVERLTVGNRPVTPDRMPVMGAVGESGRVFVSSGHGHYGLMQGPYSGELVADLAAGVEVEFDLTPYSPMRFHEAAASR